MPDTPPNPELLRSLGQLARGLSALFWGLPVTLIIGAGTASAGWFRNLGWFGFTPALVSTGLLCYGLWLLGAFQKQERPWRNTLDYTLVFALINFGLSPFLYWWNRVPEQPFFSTTITVLSVSAWLFLFGLNHVLWRLGAMLPDETLRQETRQFTAVNRTLLLTSLLLTTAYVALMRVPNPPEPLDSFLIWLDRMGLWLSWVLVFLILLPLAMTMALIWKAKEVILDSVFGPAR